jgi:DNA-directed RNA polymerase beta' subunit
MLVSIDVEEDRYTVKVKENRTIKAIFKLLDFYEDYIKEKISGKEGILRRHVYATRAHFSFRSVIISLEGEHRHDEIHIPWFIAISALKPHIISKMLKLGFDYNRALGYLYSKAKIYDPLIGGILEELIADAPGGRGIPCLIGRNPSLLQGSIQKVYISRVKPDVKDNTIGISVLALPACNGDLDGDQMNGVLTIDNFMADQTENLALYNTVFSNSTPYMFNGNITFPKTLLINISNFLDEDLED